MSTSSLSINLKTPDASNSSLALADANNSSGLQNQWNTALTRCLDALHRNEAHEIKAVKSFERVKVQLQEFQKQKYPIATLQSLALIEPALRNYDRLVEILSTSDSDIVDASSLWGFIFKLLKVSIKEPEKILRVARIFKSIGHKIELLNAYCGNVTRVAQSQEAAVDVLTYVATLCSEIIILFEHHAGPSELSFEETWRKLNKIHQSTAADIDDSFERIEKLAKLAKLNAHANEFDALQRFLSSSPSSSISANSVHEATLPCIMLPKTLKTRCWDRDPVIAEINKHFEPEENVDDLRSLALWGLGGVGKSHIALKYAQSKIGEVQAIFWIQSQDHISIAQGFSEAAKQLQLPGIDPQAHEENRVDLLAWLQRTTCRWLIIFDNAEDEELLFKYWPVASRGLVLITTRNHSLAFEPADLGIEVFPFETEAGSKFLLHLLKIDIAADLSSVEINSAMDLSKRLDGHALAISQMAGLIHRRKWSIEEFIAIYDENTQQIQGATKSNQGTAKQNLSSLETVWRLSFESLDSKCKDFLGVLSCLSPDSIPMSLFGQDSSIDLPEELKVYRKRIQFSEIQESLLNLALIRRDQASRTFSLHRLVQTQFRYLLTTKDRQKVLYHASVLVGTAFPERNAKKGQYYDRWAICRQYLQHVISLKDNYKNHLDGTEQLVPCAEFCRALVNCGRYMIETALFEELEDVASVSLQAYESLRDHHKQPDLHAYCFNLLGVMWGHRGQFQNSEPNLVEAFKIRSEHMSDDLDALSWAHTDLGNCVSSLGQQTKALELHIEAEVLRIKDGRLSEATAVGNQNIGRTLYFLGRLDEAHERLSQSMSQLADSENWAMVAYTRFVIASVYRAKGKLNEAKEEYIQAQDAFLHGGNLHTHHFNGACMYKLGCVALEQGELFEACLQLENALVVAKLQSAVMIGVYARVLYKLAEALRFDTTKQLEADEKMYEAESILEKQRKILGYTDTKTGEEAYDSLVYVLWR